MSSDDEFNRDQTEMRLKLFYERRPPAFAKRGWLNPAIHTWLEGMVRGENRTLLVGGPTGTGKSWSLWKSVETLLVNGWRGRWEIITATEFAEAIRPPVDELRLIRIRECELLCMDDLGAWRVNEWAGEHIYGIVDHRWAHQKPIVITSNKRDFEDLLGDRVGSRLGDRQTRVLLDGPDMRAS